MKRKIFITLSILVLSYRLSNFFCLPSCSTLALFVILHLFLLWVVVYRIFFVFCLVRCRRCLKVPDRRRVDSSLGTEDFRQEFSFSLRWGPLSLWCNLIFPYHWWGSPLFPFFLSSYFFLCPSEGFPSALDGVVGVLLPSYATQEGGGELDF